jgi:hypothetical protein
MFREIIIEDADEIQNKVDNDENISKDELIELITLLDDEYLNDVADCVLDYLDDVLGEDTDGDLDIDDLDDDEPQDLEEDEINELVYKNAVHHKRKKERVKKMKPSERRKQRMKYRLTKFKNRAAKRRKRKSYKDAVKKGRHIPQKRIRPWAKKKS